MFLTCRDPETRRPNRRSCNRAFDGKHPCDRAGIKGDKSNLLVKPPQSRTIEIPRLV